MGIKSYVTTSHLLISLELFREINILVSPVSLSVSMMPRCFHARIGQGSHAVVGGLFLDSFTDFYVSRYRFSLSIVRIWFDVIYEQ